MRTELDHLPANKRSELDRVVHILFEEFEDAHGNPSVDENLETLSVKKVASRSGYYISALGAVLPYIWPRLG